MSALVPSGSLRKDSFSLTYLAQITFGKLHPGWKEGLERELLSVYQRRVVILGMDVA
jgi:hypothetical protein